jgi:hypothetical protein
MQSPIDPSDRLHSDNEPSLALVKAVETARVLTADAAATARQERETAGQKAEELVAEQAARNAVAAESRAEIAASLVRHAAALAQAVERDLATPGDPVAKLSAARMATTVKLASVRVAAETAAQAQSEAENVAASAELMTETRSAEDKTIEAQVAAAADAVKVAAQTAARLAGPNA